MLDYYDILDLKEKKTKVKIVESPLKNLSDEDLLDMPAHLLAARIREAALGGKNLYIGDSASTVDAVVRIPPEEANIYDYKPRFTKDNLVPHPPSAPLTIPADTRIVNKAIPPRVCEPSPPSSTRVTKYDATTSEVRFGTIHGKIIRAYSLIQIVHRCNGDYRQLAKLLSNAWGFETFFDPDMPLDFIGDISLPRFTARSTKRRFEIYINIGWDSLVTAGMNQATSYQYGSSAVINWQRRNELARLYIHVARMLEGEDFSPDVEFMIRARVPMFSVQHANWEDFGIRVVYETPKLGSVPNEYKQMLKDMSRSALAHTLQVLSASVRAHFGSDIDKEAVDKLSITHKYEKLRFIEDFSLAKVKTETPLDRKTELAFMQKESQIPRYAAASKSHDFYTAVIESVVAHDSLQVYLNLQTVYILTILSTYCKIVVSQKEALDLAINLEYTLNVLNPYIKIVQERLTEHRETRLQDKLKNILGHNIPNSLIDKKDFLRTIRQTMLYHMLLIKKSKVRATVNYHEKKLKEKMQSGIRSKKVILVENVKELCAQLAQDIYDTNNRFYTQRYRARAQVYRSVTEYLRSDDRFNKYILESCLWYLMSDLVKAISYNIQNNNVKLYYGEKQVHKSFFVFKRNLCYYLGIHNPWIEANSIKEVVSKLDDFLMKRNLKTDRWKDKPISELWDFYLRYIDLHQKDYSDTLNENKELLDEEGRPINLEKLAINLDSINPRTKTPEDAYGHIMGLSGYANLLDPDYEEELEHYFVNTLIKGIDNPDNYIEALLNFKDKKKAGEKVEEWMQLYDQHNVETTSIFELK